MKSLIKLIFVVAVAISFGSFANDDDLIIDSENQDLDYKNNTMYFSGNVSIKQGNLSIKADELFVITKDGVGEKLIAKGRPALFSQQDPNNDALKAQALEVIYLINERILQLNGNAKYQQGASIVESGNIEFDLAAQRVKADGGEATGGRVTTTIKTKKKQPNN